MKLNKTTLGLGILLAITLGGGYQQWQRQIRDPEAVLVLGGSQQRERYAAKMARQHPDLPVIVSSGSPRWYAKKIFENRGISRDRVTLDYQAQDTVTNFTTLVDELQAQEIDSLYVVTSQNHMARARVVGEIVLGSHGITMEPKPVPTEYPPEPFPKVMRDGARALLWVTTGATGASLAQHWHQGEAPEPKHKVEQLKL